MSSNEPENLQKIKDLQNRLSEISQFPDNTENFYIYKTVELAVESASDLNYGVGAILVDPKGDIVAKGQNQVFHPYFQSGLHAEMDALNHFEGGIKGEKVDLKGYTIYTSLEPCPMCMSRILMAGVGYTVYAAEDELGGMIHIVDDYLKTKDKLKKNGFDSISALPPVWEQFYIKQNFRKANCNIELQKLAMDAFLLNIENIRSRRR